MAKNMIESSLNELAKAINSEHEQCVGAIREGLAHAIKAGEYLTRAKEQCDHGQWLPWLAGSVGFSERTAQNYMRVYSKRDELEAKAQRVADLSYREAVLMLAEPQEVEIHEFGKIFPEDAGVVDAITQSLESGAPLYNPITLYEGKILDGKLRYQACKRAGVKPTFNTFPDDFPDYKGDALDFLLSSNSTRSHFTETQRAVVWLRLGKAYTETEDWYQDRLGKLSSDEITLEQCLQYEREASELQNTWAETRLKLMYDVGTALLEIRDSHLYREDYSTFEDYCRGRWGLDGKKVEDILNNSGKVST